MFRNFFRRCCSWLRCCKRRESTKKAPKSVKTDRTQRSSRDKAATKKHKQLPRPAIRDSEYIQMLYDCEERCEQIITEARDRFEDALDRVEHAADEEIEPFRQERERLHQEWLKQSRAYEQQEALQIRAEERRRIRHLGELVAKNRQTALELIEQAVVNIRPQMQQHMRRREAGILRNCRGRQNGRTKSTSSRSNRRSLGRQNGRTKSTSSRSNRRSFGRQNGRTKSASSHSNMF